MNRLNSYEQTVINSEFTQGDHMKLKNSEANTTLNQRPPSRASRGDSHPEGEPSTEPPCVPSALETLYPFCDFV